MRVLLEFDSLVVEFNRGGIILAGYYPLTESVASYGFGFSLGLGVESAVWMGDMTGGRTGVKPKTGGHMGSSQETSSCGVFPLDVFYNLLWLRIIVSVGN